MRRSFFMIFLMMLLAILLFGCAEADGNDYETWRSSKNAEDLNGDQKIDRADYEIYLAEIDYQTWKNSDQAEDLNGDRKIDKADYAIFLSPPLSNYEIWKASNNAIDLNNDGIINESDYALYLVSSEFVGTYSITNYVFDGSPYTYVGNKLYLAEFGQYLEQITFVVDIKGDVVANIPSSTIASFGSDFAKVLEALNNVSFNRISPFLVGLDTSVTIDSTVVNVTLYLTAIENGFITSYVMNFNDETGTISFNLIKN
jgi:hypothetical protein